jgi:hydroxymethylbilane synthase
MKKIIRLGSRGSPLALVQAEEIRKCLFAAHPNLHDECDIEIVPIRTAGDWKPEQKERTFIDLGGNKAMFTKEIEEALLSNHIDMAAHSMKDMDSILPQGLEIGAMLSREDPRDAFIASKFRTLDELPSGAVVGTSSLRRKSQIIARRPDLKVVPFRGNVDTRLQKLANGAVDATLLAVAGLKRLGFTKRISSIMEIDIMLPAAAQGAVGVEIRRGDSAMAKLLAPINCVKTSACVTAERTMLRILDGSCETPIAALAKITQDNHIEIEGLVAKPDGSALVRLSHSGPANNPETVGEELGAKLKGKLPADFFTA